MSYEIATKFSINRKNNTYTITTHSNNVHPADDYTCTYKMDSYQMLNLAFCVLEGGIQPTNSCYKLNYAYRRAFDETKEEFSYIQTYDLVYWMCTNQVWILNNRILNPVEQYYFERFMAYLFEEDSKEQYKVIKETCYGDYYCQPSRSKYSYKYGYTPVYMPYKKAYAFWSAFKDCGLKLQTA